MFEYNMSAEMAKNLLANRKGSDKKLEPQTYLKKVINETFGLLHPVTKVYMTL